MKRLSILIAVLALGISACGEPDPNVDCRNHGGVKDVKVSGNNINAIICQDGSWFDGKD